MFFVSSFVSSFVFFVNPMTELNGVIKNTDEGAANRSVRSHIEPGLYPH